MLAALVLRHGARVPAGRGPRRHPGIRSLPGRAPQRLNQRLVPRELREEPHAITWETCWIRVEEPEEPPRTKSRESQPKTTDIIRVCAQEATSSDGFRLLWYHSQRKAELDEITRAQQCQRAFVGLEDLQRRLTLPRTRYRKRAVVERAVRDLLEKRQVESLLRVDIRETEQETFHQLKRGRPTEDTPYRREVTTRYQLRWQIDEEGWRQAQAEDGVFPLLTNERQMTPREVLEAYKRQPTIEKRFSQLKSDYQVAPVFLKNPQRILGLFTVYFLAMLVQALIERELRRALERERQAAKDKHRAGRIALYPEGRGSRRPTTRRILDALEPLRRYEIHRDPGEPPLFFDELTPTQERLISLFGLDPQKYGR